MAKIDLEAAFGVPVVEELDAIAALHGVEREDIIAAAVAEYVRAERCNCVVVGGQLN